VHSIDIWASAPAFRRDGVPLRVAQLGDMDAASG
jgi:hypothetical protein